MKRKKREKNSKRSKDKENEHVTCKSKASVGSEKN